MKKKQWDMAVGEDLKISFYNGIKIKISRWATKRITGAVLVFILFVVLVKKRMKRSFL